MLGYSFFFLQALQKLTKAKLALTLHYVIDGRLLSKNTLSCKGNLRSTHNYNRLGPQLA